MMGEPSTAGAPTIVLLHGLGANRQAFQRFVKLLPSEWDVRPLDLLGHGEAPKPESGYSLDDYARHLHDELAAANLTGESAPIIAGHSLGAAVAIRHAAAYPADVRALILLDPPRTTADSTRQMLDAKLKGGLAETIDRLFPQFSEPLRRWTLGTWEQMAPGVARELNSEWHQWAGDIRTPMTLIRGEAAHGATGEDAAAHLPGADEVVIEGAGHYLHATHARDTAAALVDAVRRHAGAGVAPPR